MDVKVNLVQISFTEAIIHTVSVTLVISQCLFLRVKSVLRPGAMRPPPRWPDRSPLWRLKVATSPACSFSAEERDEKRPRSRP